MFVPSICFEMGYGILLKSFILAALVISSRGNNYQLTYGVANSTGKYMIPINFDEDNFKPIQDVTKELCDFMKDPETCLYFQDDIIDRIYSIRYAPSSPFSLLEDFLTNRTMFITYLHGRFNYNSYLEIGCGDSVNFLKHVQMFPLALCVDPNGGGTHKTTSDDFFDKISPVAHPPPFDLIFIDGLHTAKQVYTDILNSIRVLRPNGLIMIHDCHPRNEDYQAHRDTGFRFWLGDGWKAVVVFMSKYRHQYDIITGDFDMGITLIRRKPNATSALPPAEWDNRRVPLPNTDDHSVSILLKYISVMPSDVAIEYLTYDILTSHRHELLLLNSLQQVKNWL